MCLNEFGSTDIALYRRWKRKFRNVTVRICVLRDVKTCTVAVPTFRRNRLLPALGALIYEGGIFRPYSNFVPHYTVSRPNTTNRKASTRDSEYLEQFYDYQRLGNCRMSTRHHSGHEELCD